MLVTACAWGEHFHYGGKMKTVVTYTLVVEIKDVGDDDFDNEQRAIDMVMDEPQRFIKNDSSNLTVTTVRAAE